MSSSVSFPDWNSFSSREEVDLGAETAPVSPASELMALLQTYQVDHRKMEERLAQERQHWLDLLVQQALLVGRFEIMLSRYDATLTRLVEQPPRPGSPLKKSYNSFRILKEQMAADLASAGIAFANPLGKPYNEVENVVTVDGWRHHQDYTEETVIEVTEAVVYFQGELVHQGRVVMGGPPPMEDEASEDAHGGEHDDVQDGNDPSEEARSVGQRTEPSSISTSGVDLSLSQSHPRPDL